MQIEQLTQATIKAIRDARLLETRKPLGSEYFYHSLPLCVIDAVFSIGVVYKNVTNVVQFWCKQHNPHWPLHNSDPQPPHTISDFLAITDGLTCRALANRFFNCNKQRTSTRNGILKADATVQFAKALQAAGIEGFPDMKDPIKVDHAWQAVSRIAGQGSRLSFDYLEMLAGDETTVKADRMLCRFVGAAANMPPVDADQARAAVIGAQAALVGEYPDLTPRHLDYLIWNYQKSQSGPRISKPCA